MVASGGAYSSCSQSKSRGRAPDAVSHDLNGVSPASALVDTSFNLH